MKPAPNVSKLPTLAVVLTAAVAPTVDQVAVADPQVRLAQYRQAFSAWAAFCARHGHSMLIVETTDFDIESLVSSDLNPLSRRPLGINYKPPAELTRRGKGAIEVAAIQQALQELPPTVTTVYKVTGRLWVANADRVVAPLPPHTVVSRTRANGKWLDSRFFGFSRDIADFLFENLDKYIDDDRGAYLEKLIATRVAWSEALGALHATRFTHPPQVIGQSGSTGQRYRARNPLLAPAFRKAEDLLFYFASRKAL